MINKKTDKINIDLEKYVLYKSDFYDCLIAATKDEADRILKILHKYEHLEKTPDEETMDGIKLDYDSASDSYIIKSSNTSSFRLNKLSFAWIRLN